MRLDALLKELEAMAFVEHLSFQYRLDILGDDFELALGICNLGLQIRGETIHQTVEIGSLTSLYQRELNGDSGAQSL